MLICDLAETYGIYDYKAMKPSLIATLAVGLPESSRIIRRYNKINLTIDQMLLAMIEDSLNGLIWGLGGKKSKKRPKSIFKMLTEPKKEKDELMTFRSPEDFDLWMERKREQWDNG